MEIFVGSGKLYVVEYTGTIPESATLEVDANLLGATKDGGELTYTPSTVKLRDDSGKYSKILTTDEEATFKSKMIAYENDIFAKLSSTCTITTTQATSSTAGKHDIKIGGVANQNSKKYVVRFVRDSATGDEIKRITLVGVNTSGITMAFKKDDASAVDVQFDALPQDSNGTLIHIEWNIPATTT